MAGHDEVTARLESLGRDLGPAERAVVAAAIGRVLAASAV